MDIVNESSITVVNDREHIIVTTGGVYGELVKIEDRFGGDRLLIHRSAVLPLIDVLKKIFYPEPRVTHP